MYSKLMALIIMVVIITAGYSLAFAVGKRPNFTPREVKGVVNINQASAKELGLLPGIGRRTAQSIIAYRQKQLFKAPHDIVQVKGVGEALFNKIKAHLTISGPSTIAVTNRKATADAAPDVMQSP